MYDLEFPGLDATDEEVHVFKAQIRHMDLSNALYNTTLPLKAELEHSYLNLSGLLGDGKCQGPLNIKHFGYDSGDCCMAFMGNNSECNDESLDCACHIDETIRELYQTQSECGVAYTLVGDGICQGVFNNEACNFDGGDCCLSIIHDDCFGELCKCNLDNTIHEKLSSKLDGCSNFGLAINGECNDETNVEECMWDLGQCCKREIIRNCHDCICHEDNMVHYNYRYHYSYLEP